MRNNKENLSRSAPPDDYVMTGREADEMEFKSSIIRMRLGEWKKQGYDVKIEPTSTEGLRRITISDPKTGEIVFYEDEELLRKIERPDRTN